MRTRVAEIMHKSRIGARNLHESRVRGHTIHPVFLVDRGFGTTGCVDIRPAVRGLSFSLLTFSIPWSPRGMSRRFPLSSSPLLCTTKKREEIGSPSHLCLISSSAHICLAYISLSFFSPLSLLETRASHTDGRKSRNRPAGNPPLARDPIDLVPLSLSLGREREGSAGPIGVLVVFLSRVAHVRTYAK